MTRTNFTRIAGATLVAGFASLALATPAGAMEAPDPGNGGLVFDSDSGVEWADRGEDVFLVRK